MKAVTLEDFTARPELHREAGQLISDQGGLVCFPCANTYSFGVNLVSDQGVLGLMQTKRRSKKTHALVMVADANMAALVADPIPDAARKLMETLWPGRITIRLALRRDLPRKVYKELSKPDGMVGLRHPGSPTAAVIVEAAGVPVLVSSANKSKKVGAASVASIRQQFARNIDLFIETGDLADSPPSTVVGFSKEGVVEVVRPGEVSEEEIMAALAR